MIQTHNVSKRFEGLQALRDVSILVPSGSVYGLVGSNGAGKTTLIHLLSGAYRPDEGRIEQNGLPVYENVPVKSRIGTMQDMPFYWMNTKMAELHRMYRSLYPAFDEDRYAKMAGLFSFGPRASLRKMSKGMRQQAALWLLLCCGCDTLLLDEPIEGLDPVMRKQIWSLLMSDAAERGTTILISSHNLRELEDVCDRVGILHEGRLLFEADLAELQSSRAKVQFAFDDETTGIPPRIELHAHERSGKLHTAILSGDIQAAEDEILALSPVFYEKKSLTLEEIFLFELGGEEYAAKDIFS